ncbi:8195_t:CDS:10 [Diversispora eburnea]|uniref:DNA-dependent protein kinase catalytic subunit n=1 Tax=Diversispora eburnea TaxID=1213867 RepID=A0A9N8ZYY8_9GLOM|nr:8195_t:CDS:10 [Diversispora eburnea]
MSSIDKLLKCLQELSVCRQNILQLSKNSLFQENGEALKYCEDIEQIFNDIDDKELGLASKLLFDPNIGIIKFLLELINVFDKTLQKAKIALLEFLFLYIKRVKAGIEPYSEQIKEGCFSILQFDDEAFVRAASFKPMMAMFDFSIPIIDPEKLHVQDILKRYLDCIFVKSKMQASIKAHRFPKQSEKDAEKILRVFVNMLKDPGNSNAAFKIGFDYIIDHSSIFGKYYLQHYEELWTCLWVCCEHINRDLKRSAFKAIGEFLKTYFISKFVNIWKTRNSEQEQKVEIEIKDQYPKGLSIAVRGVGYFAAPAKKIMDKVKLQQLFQDLLKPGSLVVLSVDENEILANVYQIPLFIEAFCYIGQEFDVIFDELLETIEQEVRIMLIYYPRLIHDLRIRGANAFEQLLWMLYKKGSVYQALILTCSDAIQSQQLFDNQRQDIPNIIDTVADHTYQEMFHLWNHIFSDSTLLWVGHQMSEDIENNSDAVKEFFTILYDEFFLAIFRIIRALNFKVIDITTNTENTQEIIDSNLIAIAGSSDLSNLQPVVSKDFIIFQNLVDFWQLFLPGIRKELFSRWVYLAGDNLISLSTQYPYVSGFYKMVGSCLKICESIQYFTGVKNLDIEMENVTQSQFLPSTTSMQRVSYFLYSKFIKEVCARLVQYKDDLLASCLRLVLSVPKELLNINDLVSPICIALKLGQSYQPLTNIGLDVIEKIVDLKGPQDLSKWLGQILPFLNDYLLVKADTMDNSLKEIAQFRANSQKNRNGLKSVEKARKQKIKESGMIKSFKTIVGVGQLEKNVGLYDLQVRVLRILGRLGGVNKLIIEDISNEGTILKLNTQFKSSNFKNKSLTSNLLAWDPERPESAPDRKTKVISCELLHSIMLLMIGRSAFQARITKGPQESPFCKIYHRIFPVLLRLAIDTDQVPRKLFRRLVSQLIHWFTNNAQYENPETMTLLQCCLDATCDSWGSLRDYGAECLNEFLLWSIKQSSNQQIEKDPLNIKSLFNRLYNASAHPDYTKRLGASLAINHIYRVFREEEYLVNHFTFELLYWTLFNLRLSEQDQDAIGTRQQAIMAIRHLKKIINLKSNLFLTKINNRRKFPGLPEANLLSLVNWLFMETNRKESDYANMYFKNGLNWVNAKISSQPSFLLDLYKTSALSLSFDQNKGINFSQNKEWCARFLSFLENYTWIIKEKFISPEVLMQKEMFTFRDSINIFINKMVLSIDLDLSLNILEFDDQSSNLIVDSEEFLTPAERSQLTKCRIKMTNSFIDFIIALLEAAINDNLNVQNSSIFNDLFFKALARWLFFAEKLELGSLINNNNENSYDGFSRKLYTLLSLFKQISHSDSLQFNNCIQEISMVAFSKNVDLLNIELESSAYGFKMLNDAGIFDDLFNRNLGNFSSVHTVHNYISLICDKIVSLRDVKYPHWIQLLNNLLTFVLSRNSNDINKWLLSDLIGYSRNSSTSSYEDSCNYYQKANSYGGDQKFLLKLWKDLIKLDSNLLKRQSTNEFKQLFYDIYLTFLTPETELDFKSEAFDLLPAFLKSDMPKDKIEELIEGMLNYQFPLLSSEYSRDGPKNIALFKIFVPTFVRETDHIYANEFQEQLGLFVSHLSGKKFVEMSDIAFGYFQNSKFANFHRNIIQSILTPILMQGSKNFVIDFYKKCVKELIDIIERDPRIRNDQERIYELDAKAVNEEDIYTDKSEIVQSYCRGRQVKAKELTRKVMEISHKTKSKSENDEFANNDVQEARLLFRCAAYNALAAAIMCTQTGQQFYKTFLFSENVTKGEYTWENIVDLKVKFEFKVELDQPFFKTKLDDFRSKSSSSFQSMKKSSSLKYLTSQYLVDSSITGSTDLFDNTITGEFTNDDKGSIPMEMDDNSEFQSLNNLRELEVDSINRNPCMKMIIRAIERLHTTVTPPPSELVDSMPGWMNDMHKKFTKKETHINIRLFIAKIITNIPEAFEKNICHKNRPVLHNNLQTIKGIFEIWHEFIVVPTRVIYDYIKNSNDNQDQILAGLQLLGIVLAHDKPPFQQEVGIDLGGLTEETFYWDLVKKLNHAKFTIRNLFSDKFIRHVFNLLPRLTTINDKKFLALELISFCADKLLIIYFCNIYRNDSEQLIALRILNGILKQQYDSELINYFLETLIESFYDHQNIECRNIPNQSSDYKKIKKKVKSGLLRGLADVNESIQQTITEFWHEQQELSQDTFARLKVLIGNLYSSEIETIFLHYACFLLLEGSKKSPDYNKPMFDQPLPHSKFDNYDNIDTSWQFHSTMTPLFVNTQQSNPNKRIKSNQDGFIRATNNNYEFSLTIDPETGSMSSMGSQLGNWSLTQSNLFFSPTSARTLGKRKQILQEDNSLPTQISQYQNLRKRVFSSYSSSQASEKEFYRKLAHTKKKRSEISTSARPESLSQQVSMLRQYRVGDLPDIEIKFSEIVVPLQALAQRDLEISRILFTSMFVSLYNLIDENVNMEPDSQEEYKDSFARSIRDILINSTTYFSPLISSCLRICFEALDTRIDPTVIRKVSEICSSESMGISLIERQLSNLATSQRGSKRIRVKESATPESLLPWVELANLYKSIDSHDIYKSIYENHIAHSQVTKDALNSEFIGDYGSACKLYLEALGSEDENADENEIRVWEEGRFECYVKLSQWDDLAETVLLDIDRDLDKLWDDDYQDPYLQYFMRSMFKLAHGTDNHDSHRQMFLNFIENAMNDSDHKTLLTSQYPIALTSIARNEFEQARSYVRKAYDSFLFNWSTLHPLAIGTRLNKLSSLQEIVEMEEYLNLAQSSNRLKNRNKLTSCWSKRYPSKQLDPTNSWDDIITSRHLILGDMTNWLREDQNFNAIKNKLECQELLKMSSAARVQGNFEVARVCLSKCRTLDVRCKDDIEYYEFKLQIKEAMSTGDTQNRATILKKMTNNFEEIQISDTRIDLKCRVIECETYSLEIAEFDKPEIMEKYSYLGDRLNSSVEKAMLHLKPSDQAKIFVKFAKFCDNYLRRLESDDNLKNISIDKDLYASSVVQNILRAIEYGSKEASEFFPRLLQIIDLYEPSQQTFELKVKSFGPVWKLIRWIPQIVAVLDKPSAQCLADLYPNSLYYPLKISSEHYKFDEKNKFVLENKCKIQQLKQIIKSDVMEILIEELERLSNPENIFKSWIQTIGLFLKILNHFSLLKEFASRHSDYLIQFCGIDGSKLAKMIYQEFLVLVNYWKQNIGTGTGEKKPGANLLKSYSTWLAEFSWYNVDGDIEIPGQYDGLTIPDPRHHVKIANFEQRVLVLNSIRKPRKITIVGTDGNDYPFLVKGGEDLRLDQRVILLFSIMNELLRKDFYCSQRKLELRIYKVIPMTGSLGIIEWLPETQTIKSFIERELFNEDIITKTQEEHTKWAMEDNQGYPCLLKNAKRDDVVKHITRLQSKVNANSLKKALYKLAASPEAHLSIRSEFVKKLAVINVCGYLIGIGDRHSENYLIDFTNGSLVSIDFGHAFGSATETIDVPELVPFRLTKQIESLMYPLGPKVMHAHKDILLNAMEIFVKEPLLDWQTRARKQARYQRNQDSNEIDYQPRTEWYPRKKLDIARRKLEGENPAYIVCEELMSGHARKPFIDHIQDIAKGSPEHNIRARVPQKCGSVKEQIECLIDLATDPYVLGVMWVGWISWV